MMKPRNDGGMEPELTNEGGASKLIPHLDRPERARTLLKVVAGAALGALAGYAVFRTLRSVKMGKNEEAAGGTGGNSSECAGSEPRERAEALARFFRILNRGAERALASVKAGVEEGLRVRREIGDGPK